MPAKILGRLQMTSAKISSAGQSRFRSSCKHSERALRLQPQGHFARRPQKGGGSAFGEPKPQVPTASRLFLTLFPPALLLLCRRPWSAEAVEGLGFRLTHSQSRHGIQRPRLLLGEGLGLRASSSHNQVASISSNGEYLSVLRLLGRQVA